MGARFYAADLGVWTAADPGLLNSPQRGAGADFGAVNAYAYANLSPIGAKDPDGEFWHIVAGAAVGALVGGGVEAARQYIANGKVEDWGRVGSAAVGGGVAGIVTTANPAAGFFAVMAVGAGSSAAAGVATRLVESGGKSAGTVTDVMIDVGTGAVTGGVVKGSSAVVSKVTKAVAPKAARAVAKIRSLSSEKTFQKQYKMLGEGTRKAARAVPRGPGPTVDPTTGQPVGRFVVDARGNAMIEPVGGRTVAAGKGGVDTHTTYPNGSNYQRLNPQGHAKNAAPHAHGHAPGTGPGMKGQGPSLGTDGTQVPFNSSAAHWPIK